MKDWLFSRKKRLVGLCLLLPLLAVGIWMGWTPRFSMEAWPCSSHNEAMERFSRLQDQERQLGLRPEGFSRVFSHGVKTDRVVVLLHGLTNAPAQFEPLGRWFHENGANVVIPRSRHAGYVDRMNPLQGLQSAQDLLEQAGLGLDLAAGLGDRVSLVALSGSALAAAWMAQHREGLDEVILIAPFFSLYGYPDALVDGVACVMEPLPNLYLWWDAVAKQDLAGPPYVYPRYGSRCMASTLRLARSLRANPAPLKAKQLGILLTDADRGAKNASTLQWVEQMRRCNPGLLIRLRVFDEALAVPHDMIDLHQPDANPDLVYPVIQDWLGFSTLRHLTGDETKEL
jgi:carboxylesterase